MAAVARLGQELEQRQQQRELAPELAQVIDGYRPARVPETTMQQITPFLHAAITASTLAGAESVRKHCNHLTELALFALDRGLPLQVPALLTTSVIDDHIRTGMTGAKDGLRAERRRRLLALARTANPGPDVPAKLTPVGHSAIKPCYTPAELAAIVRVSKTQPTPARSRDLACVVSLAAGAGLDSVDLRGLYTDHIADLGADGILVHVQGPRPRVVPLRARFEDLLRTSLAGRGAGELLLGRKEDRRNTAARVTERAALHKVPHIEPARLRSTWLADLMTDQVPLAVILQAAGLKSARTLSELQPHLGPWLETKGLCATEAAQLRGER
jgi:hypothetical protein